MLEFVNELLNSQDNIIDQLKVLKENKNHKEVQKYINALVKENNSPYFNYCIDKYYFGKDVEEVKQPLTQRNIKLYPIYFKSLEIKKETKRQKLLNKVKKGDKIKVLEGCFKGTIGIVEKIDSSSDIITIAVETYDRQHFEGKVKCEFNDIFEIIKEGQGEK